MAEDKVSRREFLTKTSLAASTAVAGAATGQVSAQEPEEYVQSDYSVRAKALNDGIRSSFAIRSS